MLQVLLHSVKRIISVLLSAIASVICVEMLARFTGISGPYWVSSSADGPLSTAVSILGDDIKLAVSCGWLFGIFVLPVYAMGGKARKYVRPLAWIIIGLAFGCWAMSGGSYVYGRDWSELVNGTVGFFAAVLSEPLHKVIWLRIGEALPARRNVSTRGVNP